MIKKAMAVTILLFSNQVCAEGTTTLSTGFDWSSGKYGGTSITRILYIPVTAKYQTDDYFLKITVPYIRITSLDGFVRGIGRIKPAKYSKPTTDAGLGDTETSAGYTVYAGEKFLLDLVGNIKFATADASKNLGSGANDYSAQLDGSYELEKVTLLATAGYKMVGAPVGVTVNNIAYGSIGFSRQRSEKYTTGWMLDVAQASTTTTSGTRELSFFVSNKISNTTKLQANVMKGFSNSSPDYGLSLTLIGEI